MPDYNQEDISTKKNFCGPVSAANVIMYWNSNGYPNLSSSNNWINVANRLGVLMGHTNSEGVLWADFISGIKSYTTEKGYSKFSITSPAVSFGNMETEIANNRPAQIGLKGYGYTGLYGGHIVTLVGTEKYQETTQNNQWFYNLVIRDNWQSTPKDVWISYGRGGGTIEFIGAIKPSN